MMCGHCEPVAERDDVDPDDLRDRWQEQQWEADAGDLKSSPDLGSSGSAS